MSAQLPMDCVIRMDGQRSLFEAKRERDAGIAASAEHAEAVESGWGSLAYQFLRNYCRVHEFFISEDVSDASIEWGMIQPPTLRAWGQTYRRALKDGLIVQDGAGRSRRRHASICPRWRSLIYRVPR